MAGIPPVTIGGQEYDITATNAGTIYRAVRNGEVELSSAQQSRLDTVLTDEVRYEIEQETAAKGGESKIKSEGSESGDDTPDTAQAGTAASIGAAGGTAITGLVALIKGQKDLTQINGFCALAVAIFTVATTAIGVALSFKHVFDPDAGARETLNGANAGNMEQVNATKNTLVTSYKDMENDMASYTTGSAQMALDFNKNELNKASLEAEIASAYAAGDIVRAQELEGKRDTLGGLNFEKQKEELEKTRAKMEGYQMYGQEAAGVEAMGTQVSEFLKVGNTLQNLALANMYSFAAMVLIIGIMAIKGAVPKLPFFVDAPASGAAGVLFWSAAALAILGGINMGINADFEKECGQSGDQLGDAIKKLTPEIEGQQQYIEFAQGTYDETDSATGKAMEEGQAAAAKAGQQAIAAVGAGQQPQGGQPPPGQEPPPPSPGTGS